MDLSFTALKSPRLRGSLCALLGAIVLTHAACTPASADKKETAVADQSWQKQVDAALAGKVPVVLRVRLIKNEGGDKYGWDRVGLIGVIKNTSKHTFPAEFQLAHYSAEPGVPEGQSTVYLEPYNPDSDDLWKLYQGSGKAGVSHSGGT